ncbi:MAG: hypothetical protein IKS93_00505 [Methanobrevibacter sp.]|nr:hypothetical protein [Methanobrevibacter sp.]
MKDYYIVYWTIGASRASCGLEPRQIRFHCKAENEQQAIEKLFKKHSDLDEGNIISVTYCE